MGLTENALEILKKRYFAKDKEGNITEDWEGLCGRVANCVSAAVPEEKWDEWKQKFYNMVHDLEFLPCSPTLFNAGLPLGQLSACFVLPIEDSMEGIMCTLSKAALVFASGGGCGYDFSRLRKKGSSVSRTFGESSGPIPFIEAYDAVTNAIKQGGRRKGANMGILRIDHPDIEEFIDAKKVEGCLSNFNLSVAVTDEFMEAVVQDGDFELYNYRKKQVDRVVKAKFLFDKIVERAWSNGEPGIIFIDQVNRKNPLPGLGKIEATNPCAEQPLLPYESCNLGSINLTKIFDSELPGKVNWGKLKDLVTWGVRFLDCVISVNKLPFPEIEEATLRTRKIGLGVMGFADLLLLLGLEYGSAPGLLMAEEIIEYIEYWALDASAELSADLGPFPAFREFYQAPSRPESVWTKASLDWETLDDKIKDLGLRNACITTIAPTGSVSVLAGVSSAIEPNFQWKYSYNRVDQEFIEVHRLAKEYLDKGIPLPDYFVTALDISPERHIKMQATFQKWVDSGISKTINLPFSAVKGDVVYAVMTAWELGCKGVTLYRTGSREKEVLVAAKEEPKSSISVVDGKLHPRKRPKVLEGKSINVPVGDCGHLYVTINSDEEGPFEVFINLGKSGGCITSQVEALGRIVSTALRSGVPADEIIDQLSNIRCSKVAWAEGVAIRSCADGVAYALKEILGLTTVVKPLPGEPKVYIEGTSADVVDLGENPECPECGTNLRREGKCLSCPSCGYSKCV